MLEASAAYDVEQAFDWYESRRTGLGAEFLRSVAQARDMLVRDPQRFAQTREPFRWVKLRKFPYALHFRILGNRVSIIACLHFKQGPTHWPRI